MSQPRKFLAAYDHPDQILFRKRPNGNRLEPQVSSSSYIFVGLLN